MNTPLDIACPVHGLAAGQPCFPHAKQTWCADRAIDALAVANAEKGKDHERTVRVLAKLTALVESGALVRSKSWRHPVLDEAKGVLRALGIEV